MTHRGNMIITIKIENKKQDCDVANVDCINKKCFAPHRYIHQNRSIDGGSVTHQDKGFSCATRNYHGCPDNPLSL